METVIEINRRSVFSLEEARELLPVVFRITKSYSEKVEALIARLDTFESSAPVQDDHLVSSLETQANSLIQEWQNKITKLGALPKGLWIADFDSGDGYFCWRFPERRIDFWHQYSDGFSKRVNVSEKVDQDSLSGQSPLRNRFNLDSRLFSRSNSSGSSTEHGLDL